MGVPKVARSDLIADDKHVQSLRLLVPRSTVARLDLTPWAAVYAAAPAAVARLAGGSGGAPAWAYVASLVAAGALHLLCQLVCIWSTATAVRLRFNPCATVHDATHAHVVPHPERGKPAVVAIVAKDPPPEADDDCVTSTTFSYQQRTYVFDHGSGQFARQRAPVDLPIAAYREAKGLGRPADAEAARHRYGLNECRLPRRDFRSSLIEQFSGPFFVFQMFCVLLWLLDEMWHYALFTGVMLVFFECTVAMTKVRNAEQLYRMEPKAEPVLVWRAGRWSEERSTALMPGDLFALRRRRGAKDTVCPCDGLIISGSCVMNEVKLTGESVPQMKGSIATADGSRKLQMGKSVDKPHVVYAGTKLVMVTESADESQIATTRIPEPEPGAVLVYALRTGFDTSQGKLMRTILFATDTPVTANSAETFIFIGVLLVFALVASGYVLYNGLQDPTRNRWKLFLNCTMIMTSVIPPELPMELSLAVNNSLMALMKAGIYCTEPFRIPTAGKVDVCCFDKTGTLTSEKMIMHGIAGIPTSGDTSSEPALVDASDAPLSTAMVLAACHSLVVVDNRVFGDPLERIALDAIDWDLGRGDKVVSKALKASAVTVIRNHFDSALRRMSVVASLESPGKTRSTDLNGPHVLAKGAPETMESRFLPESMPKDYAATHRFFSLRGGRVLALGIKKVTQTWDQLRAMGRDELESDLTFCGFVVLTCPLKAASAKCIAGLRKSSHKVMMITGDHMLTACYVAQTLHLVSQKRRALVLQPSLDWRTVDDGEPVSTALALDATSLDALEKKFVLCMGGDALAAVIAAHEETAPAELEALISRVKVFARTSPEQKEAIVGVLKDRGMTVLMCGDGTNDVGALKAAHVGVGLLESEGEGERKLRKRKKKKAGGMEALLEEAEANTVVQLGDASIASPFTSRTPDISSTLDIIRQGRCTLVTTTQMFKIIAINCLITAYSLSVLYLDGVKFGDSQATMQGLGVAGAFLFITRSKPLDGPLAAERPFPTIFRTGVVLSMIGQFAVHLACLMVVTSAAKEFQGAEPLGAESGSGSGLGSGDADEDEEFKPTILNSAVFLMTNAMLATSFVTNYRGRPFMEGLLDNRPLMILLGLAQLSTFAAAAGIMPELNEQMEIILEWPDKLSATLLTVLAADFVGSLAVEEISGRLFPLPTAAA